MLGVVFFSSDISTFLPICFWRIFYHWKIIVVLSVPWKRYFTGGFFVKIANMANLGQLTRGTIRAFYASVDLWAALKIVQNWWKQASCHNCYVTECEIIALLLIRHVGWWFSKITKIKETSFLKNSWVVRKQVAPDFKRQSGHSWFLPDTSSFVKFEYKCSWGGH